jgi:hypothetical protein
MPCLISIRRDSRTDYDEEQNRDEEKGKNVEIIESPKIAEPRKPGNRRACFLFGVELLTQDEDVLFTETKEGAANFIGVEFPVSGETIEPSLLELKELFDFLR